MYVYEYMLDVWWLVSVVGKLDSNIGVVVGERVKLLIL